MEQQELKVCLVQSDTKHQDVNENLKQLGELIDGYYAGADLIILPEMFTTGFSVKPRLLAEPVNGKTVQWMMAKAKALDAAIMGSVIIEDTGKYYNRIIFALPSGEIKYYDKRHLFRMGNEHIQYDGGGKRLIVNYRGWRICPLICYDLRFPVWSRNCNDYDLLVYIANWPVARVFAWKSLLIARAIENQCYVVGVNRVGVGFDDMAYSGDSVAIDSNGAYLAQATPYKEDVVVAVLSKKILLDSRKKFPVMLDIDRFEIKE